MALTTAQQLKARLILGYSYFWRYANPRLDSAIAIVSNDVDMSAEAVVILTQIAAVDTQIASLYGSAGIKKADEVEFFASSEGSVVTQQRKLGRQLCNRMSLLVGVPIANDYFGESGYGGDDWATSTNQGSGYLPLS